MAKVGLFLAVECQWTSVEGVPELESHYFATVRVKIVSGENYQWMLDLLREGGSGVW